MVIEFWSQWFKRTLHITRRANPIHSKLRSLRYLPEIEGLEDRCTPSIMGNADFTSTPNGANFNYAIALHNTGTTNIGTFWFAWIPGQDYMANNPISVANPTGWTSAVTGGFPGDGYAIRWVASTAPITPGNSLNFNFTSAETPAQLGGNSQFFTNPPEGTSFIYIGAPETDPGYEFVVKAVTTTTLTDNGPNPSTFGQAVSFTATVSGGAALNGETVTIEDADNANSVVASPTLTNGTVTFPISNLAVGSHHLFAVYNGDSTHDGSNNSATPVLQTVNPGAAPQLLSTQVNGGYGLVANSNYYVDGQGYTFDLSGQNSVVVSLLATFNEPVSLDSGAFAVTPESTTNVAGTPGAIYVGFGNQPNELPVSVNTPVAVGGGSTATQWVITFSGAGTTPIGEIPGFAGVGNILKDGVYNFNMDGSKVHANAQTAPNANSTFWKMFGANSLFQSNGTNGTNGTNGGTLSPNLGDGTSELFLDPFDVVERNSHFLADSSNLFTPPFYDPAMDFDLSGFYDGFDVSAFNNNYLNDWTF